MIQRPKLKPRETAAVAAALVVALLAVAAFAFRDDIVRASLDPKIPFQAYRPPPAPDWAKPSGWLLIPGDPAHPAPADGPADVFFIAPTTYDSADGWNAPIVDRRSQRQLQTMVLPNYAGPFARIGRLFAPQYRQATLFATMTFREDARDARAFAYQDVRTAFRQFLLWNGDRPIVVVGVREGGVIAARLLHDEVASNPALRARLAAAYLIDAAVPAADFGPRAQLPACRSPGEPRCVAGWMQVVGLGLRAAHRLDHAAVWGADGELHGVKGVPLLCFNPILGATTDEAAPKRLNRGAANATGLEWGARPALLSREVSAQCVDGLLRVSRPASGSLKPSGSWADRRKAPDFDLFWADLEADATGRVRDLLGYHDHLGPAAPPITTRVSVGTDAVQRIPGK
jgi:hypothetical protein